MSGLVCPACEEGHEKCKCEEGAEHAKGNGIQKKEETWWQEWRSQVDKTYAPDADTIDMLSLL